MQNEGRGEPNRFYAFLCSASSGLATLRQNIHALGEKVGRHVWVAERCDQTLAPGSVQPFEIVDACLEQVRQCRIFLCILGERHGTAIEIEGYPARVSFVEIEVYLAALLGKPMFFFRVPGSALDPRTEDYLGILKLAYPEMMFGGTERDVLSDVRRVLIAREPSVRGGAGALPWLTSSPIRRYVGALFACRGRPLHGERPSLGLQFLNRAFAREGHANLDLVESLLREHATQRDPERRLTRLWVAVRELLAAPYDVSAQAEALPLWNRVLGDWVRSAAWYGLHGHVYLGGLAAINSLDGVRARLRETSSRHLDPSLLEPPYGARASALYSIAKRLPRRRDRLEVLQHALDQMKQIPIEHAHGDSAFYSVRGQILSRMGRASEAVRDLERMLAIRVSRQEEEHRIGEALANLGYAHLCQGNPWKGRDLLEKGVGLLEKGGHPGFLVRARKKLALALLETGHPIRARRELLKVRRIVLENRLYDQY